LGLFPFLDFTLLLDFLHSRNWVCTRLSASQRHFVGCIEVTPRAGFTFDASSDMFSRGTHSVFLGREHARGLTHRGEGFFLGCCLLPPLSICPPFVHGFCSEWEQGRFLRILILCRPFSFFLECTQLVTNKYFQSSTCPMS
jgi:hypothetical protein